MRNKLHILLNILWNITGMSIVYLVYLSIFDFIYIITHKGALDRFRVSAYFAPFDYNCHWKKRFPYGRPTKKYKTTFEEDDSLTYEEIDNYDILDE